MNLTVERDLKISGAGCASQVKSMALKKCSVLTVSAVFKKRSVLTVSAVIKKCSVLTVSAVFKKRSALTLPAVVMVSDMHPRIYSEHKKSFGLLQKGAAETISSQKYSHRQ